LSAVCVHSVECAEGVGGIHNSPVRQFYLILWTERRPEFYERLPG